MPVKSHYGSAAPVRSFEREATVLAASLAPGGGPGATPSKPPSPPASWCVEARGLELVADQPKVQEHHPEVVLVSTCPLRARAAALPITPRPAVNLVVDHGVLARMRAGRSPVVRYDHVAPDATAPAADARPRTDPGAPELPDSRVGTAWTCRIVRAVCQAAKRSNAAANVASNVPVQTDAGDLRRQAARED
jgi:hypothetical protein